MGGNPVKRRTIDLLLSWTGLVVAVVLLVAGGLLLYGGTFVHNQVHDQLASQKITFPPANSDAVKGPQFAAMRQYGGQQLVNGPQAETYANHFIAVHLSEVAGGQTYSQVSAAALANPKDAALQDQVQTLFRGTTLRGLLLNAYAFWTVGTIAQYAAIVSLVGGAALVVLAIFGFARARRSRETAATTELGRQTYETERRAA
jgi:hypothetical protein